MDTSKKVEFTEKEIVYILKEVELMLMSLHYMGSYYIGKDEKEYQKETTRFIDEWRITNRLATIRTILSKDFDTSLGEDNMDFLERAMSDLTVWEKPYDMPDDICEF